MDGVLIIDKPCGPTSHDVVACVRRVTGWKKVGHTGTLDPMATGVLALVVGRATRLAQFLSASDKVYEAEIRLGWATDTYDAMGRPLSYPAEAGFERNALAWPPAQRLECLLDRFRGTYLQAAPPFSAKKVDGVRAYSLARNGKPVEPKACAVTVEDITCLGQDDDRLRLRITCSAGFYVRSFAHELGVMVGGGAHLSALRRVRTGDFDVASAVSLDLVEREGPGAGRLLTPIDALLPSLPAVVVTEAAAGTHAARQRLASRGPRLVVHGASRRPRAHRGRARHDARHRRAVREAGPFASGCRRSVKC
jgi:tRNA pseudouridine55 synthase